MKYSWNMNLHITGDHSILFRLFVMYLLYLSILQKKIFRYFFENMWNYSVSKKLIILWIPFSIQRKKKGLLLCYLPRKDINWKYRFIFLHTNIRPVPLIRGFIISIFLEIDTLPFCLDKERRMSQQRYSLS